MDRPVPKPESTINQYQATENKTICWPEPGPLRNVDGGPIPYFTVGNDDVVLEPWLLKPYSRQKRIARMWLTHLGRHQQQQQPKLQGWTLFQCSQNVEELTTSLLNLLLLQ